MYNTIYIHTYIHKNLLIFTLCSKHTHTPSRNKTLSSVNKTGLELNLIKQII